MTRSARPILILFVLVALVVVGVSAVSAQIRGKVLDAAGEPIRETLVEIIPVHWVKRPNFYDVVSVATNGLGEFEFEEIRPGTYVLAVNYAWSPNTHVPYPTTFYPSFPTKDQALPIQVVDGKVLEAIEMRMLPRLEELTVQGKVLDVKGKPAANVHVRLENEERAPTLPVSDCRTDKNGNFFLRGFVNGKYHVSASNFGGLSSPHDTAESRSFILTRKETRLRLDLKPFILSDDSEN